MASVIFGQQSQCVVEIRVIGAVEARLVGASDDARLLAIDADEIFCTIAKVTADQIVARRVFLTRIRFAFVDILITSEMTSQKLKNLIFEHFISRGNLLPSCPSGLTLASVIDHTGQTLAIDAQMVDTLQCGLGRDHLDNRPGNRTCNWLTDPDIERRFGIRDRNINDIPTLNYPNGRC